MQTNKYTPQVLLFIVACLGGLLIYILQNKGVGISPDSVVYLSGARNLLAGQGFSYWYPSESLLPITHYPPLYSATLAAFAKIFDVSSLIAARILNALWAFSNIYLIGHIVYQLSTSVSASLFMALLCTISPVFIEIHTMAWTEPPFIFLSFLGLYLLHHSFDISSRPNTYLFFSSILLSLALLTRYIGITLIATGIIAIYCFSKQTIWGKSRQAILFLVPFIVAISVWGVRNQALSGNPTNRAITIHLITVSHLRHFASTLSTWFLPGRNVHLVGGDILPFIFLLFLIMIVLVLGHNLKSRQSWQPPKMIYIIVIFAAIYIVFLGASISFIDYLTPLDSRILSPFFVCLFIVLTYMVQQMFAKKEHVSFLMRFVFQAFIGLTLLSNFWAGASFGSVSYFSGIGFNNSSWDHSELINILEESFTTEVVYSNGFDLIYYQTNIRAEPLPKKKNRTSQVVNEDFETDLQAVNQQLSDKGGAIILMHAFEYREVFPTRADIENMFTPTSIIETTDGVIFLFSD